MKEYINHLPHYLTLIGILAIGVLAFRFFSWDLNFRIAVAVSVVVSYVVWGVVHHLFHKNLSIEVLGEYVAVAIVGLVVILSLLYRL